jgi:hypothetical protein
MLYWITPSLALTEDSALDPVEDPASAITTILAGNSAVVATTEDVYTVLQYMGLTDVEIADKIDFAMGLRGIDPADISF